MAGFVPLKKVSMQISKGVHLKMASMHLSSFVSGFDGALIRVDTRVRLGVPDRVQKRGVVLVRAGLSFSWLVDSGITTVAKCLLGCIDMP
jgi:hypothetical protein